MYNALSYFLENTRTALKICAVIVFIAKESITKWLANHSQSNKYKI